MVQFCSDFFLPGDCWETTRVFWVPQPRAHSGQQRWEHGEGGWECPCRRLCWQHLEAEGFPGHQLWDVPRTWAGEGVGVSAPALLQPLGEGAAARGPRELLVELLGGVRACVAQWYKHCFSLPPPAERRQP